MDSEAPENFAEIIDLAQSVFEDVRYVTDATPERAILRLEGNYGPYRVLVTELISEVRKYRYYVLRGDLVEAGFDNSPDPRALRLRYGQLAKRHVGELIPHLHLEDKTRLFLTEDITFSAFIDWLKNNIRLIGK